MCNTDKNESTCGCIQLKRIRQSDKQKNKKSSNLDSASVRNNFKTFLASLMSFGRVTWRLNLEKFLFQEASPVVVYNTSRAEISLSRVKRQSPWKRSTRFRTRQNFCLIFLPSILLSILITKLQLEWGSCLFYCHSQHFIAGRPLAAKICKF